MKKLDIILLSDAIITRFMRSGDFLSNKKLQKLLYYIQAWHLVYFGKQLFDERPQAWVHGPVFPTAYRHYRKFGFNPLKPIGNTFSDSKADVIDDLPITHKQADLIKVVLEKYGCLSAFQLEGLTHSESPWLEQREGLSDFDSCDKEIPYKSMKDYYSTLI